MYIHLCMILLLEHIVLLNCSFVDILRCWWTCKNYQPMLLPSENEEEKNSIEFYRLL